MQRTSGEENYPFWSEFSSVFLAEMYRLDELILLVDPLDIYLHIVQVKFLKLSIKAKNNTQRKMSVLTKFGNLKFFQLPAR